MWFDPYVLNLQLGEQVRIIIKNTGDFPHAFVIATPQEIQRYIVNPGQATCYKIGMLRLQALRDEARSSLGARFDYRNFHDVVLKNGAMPLEILEEQITAYVERKGKG